MRRDAGAPAERHPIEPPDLRRLGVIDGEEQQHHGEIGEKMYNRGAGLRIDEDALPAMRSLQE